VAGMAMSCHPRDGNGEFLVGERSPIPVPPRPCTGKFPRRVPVPTNSLQFMHNEKHIRITQIYYNLCIMKNTFASLKDEYYSS
jgi:hypothetical protein